MTPHTATASGARRRERPRHVPWRSRLSPARSPSPARRLAQTKTLKMQSTWPASLTLQDNFKMFAERVEKLTARHAQDRGARRRPDRAAVRDPGRHQQEGDRWRPRHLLLLGRQEQGRDAVLRHARRHRRHGPHGLPRLDLRRRRPGDVVGASTRRTSSSTSSPSRSCRSSPQALGWFKKPIQSVEDFKGMKCRQTGIVAEIYKRMGMNTVNMPGGEIVPSAQRGVIDCAEWVGGVEDLRLGLPQVWKYHYTPGMHEMQLDRRAHHQHRGVGRASRRSSRRRSARPPARPSCAGGSSGRSRTPTPSRRCRPSTARRSCARRRRS